MTDTSAVQTAQCVAPCDEKSPPLGLLQRMNALKLTLSQFTHRKPTSSKIPSETTSGADTVDKLFTHSKDSGYASAASTPDKLRNPTKLRQFEREIPRETLDRFADLRRLLLDPLPKYLKRTTKDYRDIAMDLKVLGENEENAKEWIVIFCDEVVSKRVNRYFKKSENRLEYQPTNPSLSFPHFELLVCHYPPKTKALRLSKDVFGMRSEEAQTTTCGLWIATTNDYAYNTATVGGIVKVKSGSGNNYRLYGMTVEHVLSKANTDVETTFPSMDRIGNYQEDEETLSDSEDEGDHDSNWIGHQVFELELPHNEVYTGLALEELPSSNETPLEKLGQAWKPNPELENSVTNLDWALVEFQNPCYFLPNHIDGRYNLKEPTRTLSEHKEARQVWLLGPRGTKKAGRLSAGTTYLVLNHATSAAETYKLTFQDNCKLSEGDCGSWIIDRTTNEVWGHVVADNVLGEAYVIPLKASFQQIAEALNAKSVCLPTDSDVVDYHRKWTGESSFALSDHTVAKFFRRAFRGSRVSPNTSTQEASNDSPAQPPQNLQQAEQQQEPRVEQQHRRRQRRKLRRKQRQTQQLQVFEQAPSWHPPPSQFQYPPPPPPAWMNNNPYYHPFDTYESHSLSYEAPSNTYNLHQRGNAGPAYHADHTGKPTFGYDSGYASNVVSASASPSAPS